MSSVNSTSHTLNMNYETTKHEMDQLALRMNKNPSISDIEAFSNAVQKNAGATTALNENLQVKHSLAREIINSIN